MSPAPHDIRRLTTTMMAIGVLCGQDNLAQHLVNMRYRDEAPNLVGFPPALRRAMFEAISEEHFPLVIQFSKQEKKP